MFVPLLLLLPVNATTTVTVSSDASFTSAAWEFLGSVLLQLGDCLSDLLGNHRDGWLGHVGQRFLLANRNTLCIVACG